MKILFLLLLMSLLASCATPPDTITVTKEVKVAVPVKCVLQFPPKPETIPVDEALSSLGLYDQIMWLIRELEVTRGYTNLLEAAVTECADVQ